MQVDDLNGLGTDVAHNIFSAAKRQPKSWGDGGYSSTLQRQLNHTPRDFLRHIKTFDLRRMDNKNHSHRRYPEIDRRQVIRIITQRKMTCCQLRKTHRPYRLVEKYGIPAVGRRVRVKKVFEVYAEIHEMSE